MIEKISGLIINHRTCINILIEQFPLSNHIFHRTHQAHGDTDQVSEPPPTVFGEMMKFSSYVAKLLNDHQDPNYAKEIFEFMEYLLAEGDEDVKDAVTTCFLENILNLTPQDIQPHTFVPYLGNQSREYCMAWDRFTGVTHQDCGMTNHSLRHDQGFNHTLCGGRSGGS